MNTSEDISTFDPFAFLDPDSDYHLISYLMSPGPHRMGRTTARLASLHHLVKLLDKQYSRTEQLYLDLSGRMSKKKSLRWYLTQADQLDISTLPIYSHQKSDLLSLHKNNTWQDMLHKAKVIVVYGLHHKKQQLKAEDYRDYERELLSYLPQHIPIYWMTYPEADPKHLRELHQQAIRPFLYAQHQPDFFSIVPLHLREIIINHSTKIQGKSLLPLRDDQRVILTLSPNKEIPKEHVAITTNASYYLTAGFFEIPVLRDYSYWFENINSLPGARSHDLLQLEDISHWIGDYLPLIHWTDPPVFDDYENHKQFTLHSEPYQEPSYIPRLIIDQASHESLAQHLQQSRIKKTRKRTKEPTKLQHYEPPATRLPGIIQQTFDHDRVLTVELSQLRQTCKALLKLNIDAKITTRLQSILQKYLDTDTYEVLRTQIQQLMMQQVPVHWTQLQHALKLYQKQLQKDWSPLLPSITGYWVLLLSIPALVAQEHDATIDLISLINRYFALVDYKHKLIPVTASKNFKFDRKRIMQQIMRAYQDRITQHNQTDNILINQQGLLHWIKHAQGHTLLLQFSADLQIFAAKQLYPSEQSPQITWYHKAGLSSGEITAFEQLVAGDSQTYNMGTLPLVSYTTNYQSYVAGYVSNTWTCLGRLETSHNNWRLILQEQHTQLSFSELDPLNTPDLQEYSIEYYHIRVELTPQSYFIQLYESPTDDVNDYIDWIEVSTHAELFALLTAGRVEIWGEWYYFNRFAITAVDNTHLQQLLDQLLGMDNLHLQLLLQTLPPLNMLHAYTTTTLQAKRKHLIVTHLESWCLATQLAETAIAAINFRDAIYNKQQGLCHAPCFAILHQQDTEITDLFTNHPELEGTITADYIICPSETISYLFFTKLFHSTQLLELTIELDESARRVAQEEIDLLPVLQELYQRPVKLLAFGSYHNQQDLELHKLILESTSTVAHLLNLRSDQVMDTTLHSSNIPCEFATYLEGLLEKDTPLVDLFESLGAYRDQLCNTTATLEDFPDFVDKAQDFMQYHHSSCLSGCNPDLWVVVYPGFDWEERSSESDDDESHDESDNESDDRLYYTLSVCIERNTRKETIILADAVPFTGLLAEFIELLDTQVEDEMCVASTEEMDFIFGSEDYLDLIDSFLKLYLRDDEERNIIDLDLVLYFTYQQLPEYLSFFTESGVSRLLSGSRSQGLYFNENCSVSHCLRSPVIFYHYQLWHLGYCGLHLPVLQEHFTENNVAEEQIPPQLPVDLLVQLDSLGFLTATEPKLQVIQYLQNKQVVDGCGIDALQHSHIVSPMDQHMLFGQQPLICADHFSTAAVMWLYDYLSQGRFAWGEVDAMLEVSNPNTISLDDSVNYLLMALHLNDEEMIYKYLIILGFKLFSQELVLSQGFLQMAEEYADYADDGDLGLLLLHQLLGRNYRKLGHRFPQAHEKAVKHLQLVLDGLDKEEDEVSWYQTCDYLTNSLLELGQYEDALALIGGDVPDLSEEKTYNHWSELQITRVVAVMEHVINEESGNNEDFRKLYAILIDLLDRSIDNYKDSKFYEKKKTKIIYLLYRYQLLFDPENVWTTLTQEVDRIVNDTSLLDVHFLILNEYTSYAIINNKVINTKVIELFDTEASINLEKLSDNIVAWYFEIMSNIAIFENSVQSITELISTFKQISQSKDITHFNHLLLAKFYLILISQDNIDNYRELIENMDLDYLYQNIRYKSNLYKFLDPKKYRGKEFDILLITRNNFIELNSRKYEKEKNLQELNLLNY